MKRGLGRFITFCAVLLEVVVAAFLLLAILTFAA